MAKLAIYLHPAQVSTVETGEDFSIEETAALSAYLPRDDSVLVPAADLRGLVDTYAAGRLDAVEDAHMVLVVRREP